MDMKRILFILSFSFLLGSLYAQNNTFRDLYENFRREAFSEYSSFRNECNKNYAEFLLKSWEWFESLPEISKPVEEEVPPIIYEAEPTPIKDNEVIHDEVIVHQEIEKPQPQPVEPIKETPALTPSAFSFNYYNTTLNIRAEQKHRFTLPSIKEKDLSKAWGQLSGSEYDNIVVDCIKLREEYNLCDWAYLMMIKAFSHAFIGNGNESTLLTAYIYSQSGYKMRLGISQDKIFMLFASKHEIYDMPYYTIDGSHYYPLEGEPKGLKIANFSFPKEETLSLAINKLPKLAVNQSTSRNLVSRDYPLSANCSVNKNLLEFFAEYPSSQIDDNPMTRWAIYAQTPIDNLSRDQLYPSLKAAIKDKSQVEAVSILLNFVQTAFQYEYDDKVWGHDRAFFAEETLNYPYCDCEDRSILFSHLVRELVGLDVLLLYYPNHLCTAVKFTEQVTGDYLTVSSGKYYICDPTYIGAPIGKSMPENRNKKPMAILLER